MAIRKYIPRYSGEVPQHLSDCPFYGYELDDEQKQFRDSIWDPSNIVTICNSRAGTGKTFISVATANLLVEYGRYNEITYIVAPVMEQKQGFIPGDPNDKNAPYRQPLDDALLSIGLDPNQVIKGENLQAIKEGKAYINFISHTYLRGVNFENQVVIIDEAANLYFDEMKKILTRIHDNCKVIIIGSLIQSDIIKHKERGGFQPYLEAFDKVKNDPRVSVCHLTNNHRGWFSNFCDDVGVVDIK